MSDALADKMKAAREILIGLNATDEQMNALADVFDFGSDTIEALRAENARLKELCNDGYSSMLKENEQLKWACAIKDTEIARLREALNGLSTAFVERLIGMGCFVADIHKDKDYRAARTAMGESDG